MVHLRAFFDPISKLTVLLPPPDNPLSFYVQTALGAAVSLLTLHYTVRAWAAIAENAAAVRGRGMIAQRRQLDKRMAEERKWLMLTVAIIGAFAVSVLPVFFVYVASLFGTRYVFSILFFFYIIFLHHKGHRLWLPCLCGGCWSPAPSSTSSSTPCSTTA